MDCRDFDPQLCIVQLTDFHFEELQSNYQKRVDDILVTIKKSIKSGTVLLLVTGDVARTGKESEYQSAAMFFDYLIEQLNQPEYQLKVYILPGIMICKARVSLLGALLMHSTIWISITWRHFLNLPICLTTDLF